MTQQTTLSTNFSLSELTRTSSKLSNAPTSPIIISNLRALCLNVLEPIRKHFNKSITIHSGYRSPAVNNSIGGSKTSQHMSGEAVDFHISGYSVFEIAEWISTKEIDYDQLILENFVPGIPTSGWVHCSHSKKNRFQNLTKFKGSKIYHHGILLTPHHKS
jgi:zinc D-Ala-D-Ala carboxypeptidase